MKHWRVSSNPNFEYQYVSENKERDTDTAESFDVSTTYTFNMNILYIYVYCNLFHLFSIFQESWTPRWIFPSWKDSPFTLHTSLTASGIFNLAAFWFPLGLVEFGLSNLGPAMAGHVFGCVGLTGYGREKKVTRNKNAENWQMFGETIWYFICFF